MGGTSGGKETLPSAVRPYRMEVPPNETLNMNRSPCLINDYLLIGEYGDLEFKSYGYLAKVRGEEIILNVHGMCRIGTCNAYW